MNRVKGQKSLEKFHLGTKGNQSKPIFKTDFLNDLSKTVARNPLMSFQDQASMSKTGEQLHF